jgi:ADP-ribose pyrophosphatase
MIERWQKKDEVLLKVGWRSVLRRTYLLPDGRLADYDIKKEPKVVTILGINTEGSVILVRQFRPGPEKVLMELPGGGLENGELPEQAARREFLEETGYTGEFTLIGSSLDCAYSTMQRFNYVATGCSKIQEPDLDENEFMEVVLMSVPEFRAHLRSGELTDIETGYLGLDYLGFL